MSTALASARRRRAGPEPVSSPPTVRQTVPPPPFTQHGQGPAPNMAPGLTLPQVISLVDRRLNTLEVFMQTQKNENVANEQDRENEALVQLNAMAEEYNSRFDIIADEIARLKDTVMKLQTFTMEVNKSLLQDRIRILSEEPVADVELTSMQ
jgi:hypothetical protein